MLARSRGIYFGFDASTGDLLVLGEPVAADILAELLEALQVDFETYRALLASEGKHFLSRIRTAG